MNTSLNRLKKLLKQKPQLTYTQFELNVLSYPKFYLKDLKTWTKLDLKKFYGNIKGVNVL